MDLLPVLSRDQLLRLLSSDHVRVQSEFQALLIVVDCINSKNNNNTDSNSNNSNNSCGSMDSSNDNDSTNRAFIDSLLQTVRFPLMSNQDLILTQQLLSLPSNHTPQHTPHSNSSSNNGSSVDDVGSEEEEVMLALCSLPENVKHHIQLCLLEAMTQRLSLYQLPSSSSSPPSSPIQNTYHRYCHTLSFSHIQPQQQQPRTSQQHQQQQVKHGTIITFCGEHFLWKIPEFVELTQSKSTAVSSAVTLCSPEFADTVYHSKWYVVVEEE